MARQWRPEDVDEIARQMAQTGNLDPTTRYSTKRSPFEEQLMALQVADKVKPSTSLGYLIGQIFGKGIDAWNKNREERNEFYDDLTIANPEQLKNVFEILQNTDPKLSERAQRKLNERSIDLSDVLPNTSQNDLADINQDTTQALARATAKGLLGNSDNFFSQTPQAVLGDAQIIDFNNPNDRTSDSDAQILDFKPGEISTSHAATPEDYQRVEHSGFAKRNLGNFSQYAQLPPTNYEQYVKNYRQSQTPQEVAPQSQETATDIEPKSSAMPQFNPEAERLKRVVQDAKKRYAQGEFYYNRAATDEQRKIAVEMTQQAHLDAEIARAQLEGMGYDTSKIGEQSTIQDANKYLASERAQNIVDTMQGEYSKNSDDFYRDKYLEARARGLSRDRAKRVAGIQAQQYQAGRVGHLNQLFNAYGFDGTAISPEGVKYLVDVAKNDPVAAQIYMKMFANLKDVFDHNNAKDLLNLGLDHSLTKAHNTQEHEKVMEDKKQQNLLERMAKTFDYGERAADSALGRAIQQAWYTSQLGDASYANRKGIDQQYYVHPTQQTYEALLKMGLSPEAARQLVIAGVANKQGKGNSGTQEQKMTEKQQDLYNQSGNLLNNARNSHSEEDVAAFEDFVNEYGKSFSPAYYQRWQDAILALRGYQCKMRGDDNGATAYWSRVRDVNVLEKMYPNENFDWYWQRRGGKLDELVR